MSNILTFTLQLNDKISSVLNKIGASAGNTTEDVRDLKKEVNNLSYINFGGVTTILRRTIGAVGFGAILGQTIRSGMEEEMRNTSFEVLFGGVNNAKRMIDDISGYAAKSPYGKVGLSEATQMMAGFGIAQDKIMPNLKAIGDIAMGDKAKLQSLTLAFSQMSSTGKLTRQDLQQMIKAGFNPLNQIAQTTGKSIDVLKDEMAKGLISSDMVTQAFQDATKEGGLYYEMIEKIMNTAGGQWQMALSKIANKLLTLYKNVLQPIILPALKKFNVFLSDPVNTIKRLTDKITTDFPIITTVIVAATGAVIGYKMAVLSIAGLQAIIGGIKAALLAFHTVVRIITIATQSWAAAQKVLNMVMGANMIGVVIGGIVALIAVITLAWNKTNWFRGGVTALWDTLKLFVKFLKDAVLNTVKGMVDTFSGLGKVIKGIFSLDWDSVKEGAKQAASGYTQGFLGGGAINAVIENGKKVGQTWTEGYKKGVANQSKFDPLGWASNKLSKITTPKGIEAPNVPGTSPGVPGMEGMASAGLGSGTGAGVGTGKDTANSIATGGTKTTHISISIGEMGNNMQVIVDSVKEGAAYARDMILDELTRALAMAQGQL